MRIICLCGLLASGAAQAHDLDAATVVALKACHDTAWSAYSDLPNAAVSAYPLLSDEDKVIAIWSVYWDDPLVRAAGNCTVVGDEVVGFEDYTKRDG